jgi:uroporphyrin-III C-methyltransferase
MHNNQNRKKVVIAGAGPGDPELVTIKAMRYLQKADVVLTDRLVSPDILNYVIDTAEIIYVGKEGYNTSSTPQSAINQLLVDHALQNKLVIRLKGGDVSIFSNILDELRILTENNIPFEIVPGITAASGAAAYAGIPLTARGYSTAVRFHTYHNVTDVTNLDWKELAKTDDTLVFYMSSQNLDELIAHLVANSISPDKLLAVIEQATSAFQQVHTCRIEEYSLKYGNKVYSSPALVIIGKVVELHESFKWFSANKDHVTYFNDKTDNRISENKILIGN